MGTRVKVKLRLSLFYLVIVTLYKIKYRWYKIVITNGFTEPFTKVKKLYHLIGLFFLVPIVPDGNGYKSKIDIKNRSNTSINSHAGAWELG